jgi:hypothetical protein
VHTRGQLLSAVAFSMALAGCSRPLMTSDGGTDAGAIDAPGILDVIGQPYERPGRDLVFYDAACALGTETPDAGFRFEGDCLGCSNVSVTAHFDSEGRLAAVEGADGTLPDDIIQCLLSSFSGYCYPALAGTTQTLKSHCWIA